MATLCISRYSELSKMNFVLGVIFQCLCLVFVADLIWITVFNTYRWTPNLFRAISSIRMALWTSTRNSHENHETWSTGFPRIAFRQPHQHCHHRHRPGNVLNWDLQSHVGSLHPQGSSDWCFSSFGHMGSLPTQHFNAHWISQFSIKTRIFVAQLILRLLLVFLVCFLRQIEQRMCIWVKFW